MSKTFLATLVLYSVQDIQCFIRSQGNKVSQTLNKDSKNEAPNQIAPIISNDITRKQIISGITESVSNEVASVVVKDLSLSTGFEGILFHNLISDVGISISKPLTEDSSKKNCEKCTEASTPDEGSKVLQLSLSIPDENDALNSPFMLQPVPSILTVKAEEKVSLFNLLTFSGGQLSIALLRNIFLPLIVHSLIHAISGVTIHAVATEGLKLF